MARDLFQERGIIPNHREGRDLFAERGIKPNQPQSEYESVNPLMSFLGGIERSGGDFMHGLIQPALESGYLGEGLKNRSEAAGASRKAKYEEYESQNPVSAQAGAIFGDIGISLPFAAAPAGAGFGAISKAPGYLKYLSAILGSGAAGAGFGAAQYVNPGESRSENAMMSGLVGAGIGAAGPLAYGAGKLTAKGINRLTPSSIIANKFGNNIPYNEILRNAAAAEGTKTGLGRILDAPSLNKTFENVTTNSPFSGGDKILSDTSKQIKSKARALLPSSSTSSDEIIHKIVLDAREYQNQFKNNLFKPVNSLAKKENFQLELPKTKEVVSANIQAIQDSPLYKNNDKFRRSLNKLFDVSKNSETHSSQIVDSHGKPLISKNKISSIVDTRVIADDLYETGQKMLSNPNSIDQQQGKLYQRIAKTMRNEVRDEINQKGSRGLKEADDLAMENYRKNYSPFLNKDIHKLINGNGEELSETFIRDVIRPGKSTDKAVRIKKIQNMLPKENRGLLGQSYLSTVIDKEGGLDPRKLVSKINSLGPRQFKALFDEPARKNILDFEKLVQLNPEAVNAMFNPKTGARNQNWASLIPALLVGQADAISGISAAALQIGGSRIFNKLMTSEPFRKKVIGKIKPKKDKD